MLLITHNPDTKPRREPWNKGKLVGPQPPFKLQEIWTIRTRLLPLGDAAARLCESTPLVCAICKADMRIVASLTEVDSVRHIFEYIGERVDPPPISPARGPPAWESEVESLPLFNPVAQPEPDFQFDQTQGW